MIKFDSQKHHLRSIRLKGFDYSQVGVYFVTVVAWQRECLFGEIINRDTILNRYGEIVQKWWGEIPVHFVNVKTSAFVIMPNHVHGIILINGCRGTVPVSDDKIDPPITGGETLPLRTLTLGQSLHILNINLQVISIPPKYSIATLIGQLKGASSHRVNEIFVSYNSFAWQSEYGVFSISEKVLPRIVEYVKNQKKHHLENRLLEALELDPVSQ